MSSWGCSWKALLSVVVTEVLKTQAEDITKVKKKRLFISFIIYSTHYHFSDWPKAYSEFSKSAPGTSSSCSMIIWYDNHIMYDRGAWFLRVIMSGSRAVCCLLICIFFKCLEINYQFHLLAWPFFLYILEDNAQFVVKKWSHETQAICVTLFLNHSIQSCTKTLKGAYRVGKS